MSTKTDAVTRRAISMPDDMWGEVEAYQKRVGAVTTADAVRRLIRAGLQVEAEKMKK
jgi:metal-responsive CopG/Arc/MetJ family transcriptional regulator